MLRTAWHRGPELDDGDEDGRHALGEVGERMAALALQARGYRVLWRNFRGAHGGEVDLVCRHRATLVFAEVKTRASLRYGRPAEAVTRAKQDLIIRGAKEWIVRLRADPDEIPVRFDVVEVLLADGRLPEVRVIPGAFTTDPPDAFS